MVLSLLASGGPNAAPPFFTLLTVVFMGIIAIALILAHFRQSLLAGYFICGVILANCGILDHIPNSDVSIQALSEVGIILLMFTLGLEFSIDELKHLRKTALVGGGIQMFICTAAFGLGLHYATGMDMSHSLTVGAIMGLSSTAVALKSFQEFGLERHLRGKNGGRHRPVPGHCRHHAGSDHAADLRRHARLLGNRSQHRHGRPAGARLPGGRMADRPLPAPAHHAGRGPDQEPGALHPDGLRHLFRASPCSPACWA